MHHAISHIAQLTDARHKRTALDGRMMVIEWREFFGSGGAGTTGYGIAGRWKPLFKMIPLLS